MANVVPPLSIQQAVAALVHELNTNEVSQTLGISRDTVTRVVAGLKIHEGTLALLEKKLKNQVPHAGGVIEVRSRRGRIVTGGDPR